MPNAGFWTVTGGTNGVLKGGPSPLFSYGFAYITNSWTNYAAQARVALPAGAFGGGFGGRFDPASGPHYAAWIYPESSPGGPSVLKLIKFQNYTGFTVMQVANMAAVGTNFHTVKLQFLGNQVTVFFDGTQTISVADLDAQPYPSGGVSLDMWTDASAYAITVDDVVVSSLPVAAGDDAYAAISGLTLTVPAPGVLVNDTGPNGNLSASLATNAAHGILNLSSNGGFTYRATNNFIGTDAFAYRANDGQTSSSPARVTITVTADHPPVANPDSYSMLLNTTFSVSAPGVLANDTDPDGNNLTAAITSGPTNGLLTLNANGSFSYTPTIGFVGSDSFTYRANDGLSNSSPAAVTISVMPPALFSDDFTRGTDPGPLSPWIGLAGSWTVTGGVMKGTNFVGSYGWVYVTNSATDYSVQARLQFGPGAFGGGLDGRLDVETGARYSAWVYPESSPGNSNVLRLLKFQNWTSFGYTNTSFSPMAQVNLAAVGTNFHSVKLAFIGNQIAVYFDGSLKISVPDVEATPYLGGAIGLDFWTDSTPYNLLVDDVIMSVLAPDNSYGINEDTTLTVAAPGVLGDDTGVYGTNLTAVLVSGVTNGTLTLNTNGGFTYRAATNYNGPDGFTYQASDGQTNLGTATVSITVFVVNDPPVFLATPTNRTINELTTLVVTNAAADVESPPEVLNYQMLSPTGATIDTNGVITWTPSEAQGPGTFTVRTRVFDNGLPAPTSATNTFTITVLEVNTAPVLPVQTNRTVNELATMTVVNTATDSDLPANPLNYTLIDPPAGAVISGNGIITWAPSQTQAPSTNLITTVVTDSSLNAVNDQHLSATNSFTVAVNVVNIAPVLPVQTNRTIAAQTTLLVTNTATEADIHSISLTYALTIAPASAVIDANGVITWTPTQAEDQSTNVFRTVVTDDDPLAVNAQHLSATNTFTVFVNSNAVVVMDSTALVFEGCTPTNNAIDPGESVALTFALRNAGTGPAANVVATLLATNGVVSPSGPQTYGAIAAGGAPVSQTFSFGATGTCGGTITVTLQLQDGTINLGTVKVVFPLGLVLNASTQNFDSVTAPALPAGWTTSASGAQTNWRTTNSPADTLPNAAFSTDGLNIGSNMLVSPAILLPSSPALLSFRNFYNLEAGNGTNGFDGGVLEIKIGTNAFVDILAAGGSFVTNGYTKLIDGRYGNPLAGRQAWSGTSLTNFVTTIANLPAAALGQTIQLRWICGTDDGNGGNGWWIDSIGITSTTCCANSAPVLAAQSDLTINELTSLTVTNTAEDSSTAPSGLTYTLVNPPAGASIDANGIITWTPSETQGPGTNTITTVVTDNGVPPLSATNSFTVAVNEVNLPPVLPVQTNLTTSGTATVVVTNTATDPDFPVNDLSYSLTLGPANASIDANGIITWTPAPGQVPSTNVFETVVTDFNPWAINSQHLSATNSFTVVVRQVNTAPVLPAQADRTIAALATLVVTNTATDADLPPNTLTYQLVNPPAGALIDSQGVITWTPGVGQAPSTNLFVTIVTDDGWPRLSATNSFVVTVSGGAVTPPVIQSISLSADLASAIISWSAVSNHTYRLQYQSNLQDISWNDLPPDVTATGPTASATNNITGAAQRFYRVMLVP